MRNALVLLMLTCLLSNCSCDHSESSTSSTQDHFDVNVDPSLHDPFAIYDEFPTTIHKFRHRRDIYTGEPVRSGLFGLLGDNYGPFEGASTGKKKLLYDDFHRILQCPISEPGIEGNRGSISLIKMIKPSKETIRLLCVWAETRCGQWDGCQQTLKEFIPPETYSNLIFLSRVINGSLYYDWPWKRDRLDERFKISQSEYHRYPLFEVLDKISDIKDSVFLTFGEEIPYLAFDVPFPALNPSPSIMNMDIPIPWPRDWEEAVNKYLQRYVHDQLNDTIRYHSSDEKDWIDNRIPKAALYGGGISIARRMIADAAILRPDLIDVSFMGGLPGIWFKPTDPTNDWHQYVGKGISREEMEILLQTEPNETFSKVGSYLSYIPFIHKHGTNYLEMKYKYIIVVAGRGNDASADRLANVLATSGAVTLLQTTGFEYHFSSRMKPWIHYVPISYNTADIIRKIEWLNQHQDFAYKIVQNARVFGESFLRLEDYYCYWATLLKTLGDMYHDSGTDVLQPFDPKPRFVVQ